MSSSLRTKASAPASSARSSAPRSSEAGEQQAGHAAQRRVEPDAADDGRAVDAGQHAVDDDRGRALVGGEAQAFLAAAGHDHAVARGFERGLQLLAEGDAVVDQQHRLAGRIGAVRVAAPHQLAGARDHVARVVGLADILVGAGRQPADAVAHLGLGREQHDRGIASPRAWRGSPAAARRRRRRAAARRGSRARSAPSASACRASASVAHGHGRQVGRLQQLRQVHADGQAVVDDEDRCAHAGDLRRRRRAARRGAGAISPQAQDLLRRAEQRPPRAACRRRPTSLRPGRS